MTCCSKNLEEGMNYQKLADLLFPNNKLTIEEIEKKYPPRQLEKNQVVSRYAPSPTGYMHVGNFFQMFISYNLTNVTNGIFFLRIEDTDSKREKQDATAVIYDILKRFGIQANEYQTLDGKDIGSYGPYVQSQRVEIYKAYAKKLVAEGKAFPCFCKKTEGKEDVLKLRAEKFADKVETEYDPCRNLTLEEVEEHLKNGEKFAIRLKTKNDGSQRIKFYDLIKGEIEAQANTKDFIILKNDGVPPYAFAHAVDDTLMGTTIVVRGEEYISSTPAHLELFEALGFKPMTYCHNPLICKIDENGNRRKVSKRYDPEADMRYYFEEGIPTQSVLEYLLNIINSSFERWRAQNPNAGWKEFKFGIKDITAVAPILDLTKLNDVSKNVISRMTAKEVYQNWLDWAKEYKSDLVSYIEKNKDYCIKVLNIDREKPKPRKDISKWSMIYDYFDYMFGEPKSFELDETETEKFKEIVKNYEKYLDLSDKNVWFDKIKEMAAKFGYAIDNAEYKNNPEKFKGNVAKVCEYIRIAITGRKNAPDLFEIMTTLGKQKVLERLKKF